MSLPWEYSDAEDELHHRNDQLRDARKAAREADQRGDRAGAAVFRAEAAILEESVRSLRLTIKIGRR